jgi:DNA-binding transcriptional ArsR family regulator
MKTVLWWLIAGSKGGVNRAKIIKELHERPYNANQITERLGLDYKTIRHHLKILSENGIIESNSGEKYGTMYFLSQNMEENYALFLEIWNKIGTGSGRKEKERGE